MRWLAVLGIFVAALAVVVPGGGHAAGPQDIRVEGFESKDLSLVADGRGSSPKEAAGGGDSKIEYLPQVEINDYSFVRSATAGGSLPRSAVAGQVRRNVSALRRCYAPQLARQPGLSGRVAVQLVIGPSGAVTSSSIASTTLGNSTTEQCIAGAFRRITFPRPSGGSVTVRFNVVLRPPRAGAR